METSLAPRSENTIRANCMLDIPSGFGDVERVQSEKPTNVFWTPGRGHQQHVDHSFG